MFYNSGNDEKDVEEDALTGDPEFIEEGDNLEKEEEKSRGVDDGLMQWSKSFKSEPRIL